MANKNTKDFSVLDKDKVDKNFLEKQVCTMEAGEIGWVHKNDLLVDMDKHVYIYSYCRMMDSLKCADNIHNFYLKIRCVIHMKSYIIYLDQFLGKLVVSVNKFILDENSGCYYIENLHNKTPMLIKISVIEQ